jgi:antitoxin HigA-1
MKTVTRAKLLDPIPPGEILLEEFLKPMGISQNQLARDIDVPVSRVAGIIAGERAITADTALRLASYFEMTERFWLNLQSDYDLRVAKQTVWPKIKDRVRPRKVA